MRWKNSTSYMKKYCHSCRTRTCDINVLPTELTNGLHVLRRTYKTNLIITVWQIYSETTHDVHYCRAKLVNKKITTIKRNTLPDDEQGVSVLPFVNAMIYYLLAPSFDSWFLQPSVSGKAVSVNFQVKIIPF